MTDFRRLSSGHLLLLLLFLLLLMFVRICVHLSIIPFDIGVNRIAVFIRSPSALQNSKQPRTDPVCSFAHNQTPNLSTSVYDSTSSKLLLWRHSLSFSRSKVQHRYENPILRDTASYTTRGFRGMEIAYIWDNQMRWRNITWKVHCRNTASYLM